MRAVKKLLLMCLVFVAMPVYALKTNEAAGEKYLIDHGHSDEIVRMVELQKSRLEIDNPEHKEFKTNNRFIKFFRNLFYERDVTMPTDNFGQDRIRTVEETAR